MCNSAHCKYIRIVNLSYITSGDEDGYSTWDSRCNRAIEPFNPDISNASDWLAYVERLEQSFTAYGIKEDIRVASFLTVIGQKTYRLLRDITSPVKPAEQPLGHFDQSTD